MVHVALVDEDVDMRKDYDVNVEINQTVLEDLMGNFMEKLVEVVERAIESSGYEKENINEVVLVGGST